MKESLGDRKLAYKRRRLWWKHFPSISRDHHWFLSIFGGKMASDYLKQKRQWDASIDVNSLDKHTFIDKVLQIDDKLTNLRLSNAKRNVDE